MSQMLGRIDEEYEFICKHKHLKVYSGLSCHTCHKKVVKGELKEFKSLQVQESKTENFVEELMSKACQEI